jgi:hypothetical protein
MVWVQVEGGPREEAGDIVGFSLGEKHWRGAIAESLDGKTVHRREKVTDAQYRGG